MKVIILLGVFLLGVLSQKAPVLPTDSCSLCTTVVDGLETFLAQKGFVKNKENVMKGIQEIENKICTALPQATSQGITKHECLDYLKLYAPYVVELFLANSDPSKICSGLGLCKEPVSASSGTEYEVVFPTLKEHSVEYEVPVTKVAHIGEQFFYKMFLANPAFLHEDMMTVKLHRANEKSCSLAMEVTNKTTYLYTTICSPSVTDCKCLDYVIHPGRGVWYYVTITAHQMFNQSSCAFSVKNTVQNIPMTERTYLHVSLFSIMFPIICCLSLCCCCCFVAKRKCRQSGACKWKCQKMCKKSDKSVSVDLQPMPNQAGDAAAAPIGYYYVPNNFGGQYFPVPQDAQPFVYPQFVAVQQE